MEKNVENIPIGLTTRAIILYLLRTFEVLLKVTKPNIIPRSSHE